MSIHSSHLIDIFLASHNIRFVRQALYSPDTHFWLLPKLKPVLNEEKTLFGTIRSQFHKMRSRSFASNGWKSVFPRFDIF